MCQEAFLLPFVTIKHAIFARKTNCILRHGLLESHLRFRANTSETFKRTFYSVSSIRQPPRVADLLLLMISMFALLFACRSNWRIFEVKINAIRGFFL